VYGFGKETTPESLRSACDKFVFTEILQAGEAQTLPKSNTKKLTSLIREALEGNSGDEGWAGLSAVGTTLQKIDTSFDPRNYGHKKLLDLLRSLTDFEVEQRGEHMAHFVRAKRKAAAK
jgi:hypothetical protein